MGKIQEIGKKGPPQIEILGRSALNQYQGKVKRGSPAYIKGTASPGKLGLLPNIGTFLTEYCHEVSIPGEEALNAPEGRRAWVLIWGVSSRICNLFLRICDVGMGFATLYYFHTTLNYFLDKGFNQYYI